MFVMPVKARMQGVFSKGNSLKKQISFRLPKPPHILLYIPIRFRTRDSMRSRKPCKRMKPVASFCS